MRNFNSYFRKILNTKISYGNYSIVKPGKVSAQKTIPPHIPKPPYYESGTPTPPLLQAEIKDNEQICKLRASCKLAANILRECGNNIREGQTTDEVDTFVHDLIISNGAYPSPLNYKHYPKSVCTSVNNVACHGIPDDRPLQNGDIINVDITVFLNGYHGDCSKTFLIGDVDDPGRALVEATEICLHEGIKSCKPGENFWAIGTAIHKKARYLNFSVISSFIGHGIGTYFHGPPDILHFRNRYPGIMKPGMSFTIEPVLSQGSDELIILDDNWTAVTADDSRTAQFEHTVLITHDGVEILTIPD